MTAFGAAGARGPREAAEWSRGHVIRTNLRAIVGRAYPRVIGLTREPSWIFFEILLPFLAVSAFVFVYRALDAPEEYIGFVVLGGAMTAFWLNVVWMMAAQFYWEKDQGNLELYFTAPMHLMSILAGMAIGGLVMTSSRALAVIVIGSWLYGVTYDIQDPWLLVGVFLLTMIPLYGMGMLFASLFLLWGREAFHLGEPAPGADLLPRRRHRPAARARPDRRPGGRHPAAGDRPRRDAAARLPRRGERGRPAGRASRSSSWRSWGWSSWSRARFALAYLEKPRAKEGRLTLRWQ